MLRDPFTLGGSNFTPPKENFLANFAGGNTCTVETEVFLK